MTTNSANDRTLQKRKGMAIKGLKAWIKALEMNEGTEVSQHKYRYEILEDGPAARVYLSETGATVPATHRTLEEWAAIGKPARLALIGLRFTKDQVEQKDGDRVKYTMNVISGEAFLSRRGTRLDNHPTAIDGWAPIGKEVENKEFESLRIAKDYGNKDAAEAVRANMVRWGIIRPLVEGAGNGTEAA